MHSILDRGSICTNYCINAPWQGSTLLRCYGGPGCFGRGFEMHLYLIWGMTRQNQFSVTKVHSERKRFERRVHPKNRPHKHYATIRHFLRNGFIGNLFWYHPQINFDRIWSYEGQINTCVFPTSHPGYALCSSVFRGGTPCKNGRKAFTA